MTTEKEPEDDEEDKSEKAEEAKLEAIGGLSMVTARNTFLLIGVTADAFAKQAYKGEQVEAIMKAVIRQLDTVTRKQAFLENAPARPWEARSFRAMQTQQ